MENKFESEFNELTRIVRTIEQDQISVDKLAQEVKHAYELINSCREQLTAIETQVNQIIDGEAK